MCFQSLSDVRQIFFLINKFTDKNLCLTSESLTEPLHAVWAKTVKTFGVTVKTSSEFKDNCSRLEPYTGTELRSGIIQMEGTFTLIDAARLRSLVSAVPQYLPAACTAVIYMGRTAVYNFSDAFRDFIGKVLADPALTDGYRQSDTISDTISARFKFDLRTSIPVLGVSNKQRITIYEEAATYLTNRMTSYTVDDKDIAYCFEMHAGFPMSAEPDPSGETVTCTLSRVAADGQETFLKKDEIKVYGRKNEAYFDSKGNYFVQDFTFKYPGSDENAVLTPGTYRLNVSSSWPALKANQFDITVAGGSGIEELRLTEGDVSSPFNPHSSLSEWFTIDGRRLSGKPSAAGLYIHRNRAVIVK